LQVKAAQHDKKNEAKPLKYGHNIQLVFHDINCFYPTRGRTTKDNRLESVEP